MLSILLLLGSVVVDALKVNRKELSAMASAEKNQILHLFMGVLELMLFWFSLQSNTGYVLSDTCKERRRKWSRLVTCDVGKRKDGCRRVLSDKRKWEGDRGRWRIYMLRPKKSSVNIRISFFG